MENASKALIIAGAILISIVIITLGVMIVNNVTGLISGASDMSEQEVATFNSKFEPYEGERVSGSNARALYDLIKSHNNQHRDDPSMQIKLAAIGTARPSEYEESPSADVADTMPAKSGIGAGKSYKIQFSRNKGSNRIVGCYITQASAT